MSIVSQFVAYVSNKLRGLADVDFSTFDEDHRIVTYNPDSDKFEGAEAASGGGGNDPRLVSGTAVGQIARWDGTFWQPTGNVKVANDGKVSFYDNAGHELLRFNPATAGLSLLHSFFDGIAGTTLTGDGAITTTSIVAANINVGQYGSVAVGQFGSMQFKVGSVVTSSLVEASPGVVRVSGQGGASGGVLAGALYIDSTSVLPANAGNIGTVIGKVPVLNEYKNAVGYVAIYA